MKQQLKPSKYALIVLGAALLGGLTAQAQLRPAHSDTVYYDAKAQVVPTRRGAMRGILTSAQPGGGVVQQIFAAEGQLLEQIPYADAQAKVREGLAVSWFATGELKGHRMYRAGQLSGQHLLFYPNGMLQQLEIFEHGESQSKQCFAPTGLPVPCPKEVEPEKGRVYAEYRRGSDALAYEVKRMTAPLKLPAGSTGKRVMVASMIGVDGRLRESRIYRGAGQEYDREALRVVEELGGQWSPQRVDGEPVESFYMINVDFLPRH